MPNQFILSFLPENRQVTAETGETVWDAACRAGIYIRGECNGKGICGKCRITPDPPDNLLPPDEEEQRLLSDSADHVSCRLACRAGIKGPVTIRVPDIPTQDEPVTGKTDIFGDFSLSPSVERLFAAVPDAAAVTQEKLITVTEMMMEDIKHRHGREIFFHSLEVLRSLSIPEWPAGEITLVLHDEKGITSVYPGRKERSLGLALDIGTTTVAAYVCDMRTGHILFADALLNPQRRYGEDIISRIETADRESPGLNGLHAILIHAVNALINQCLSRIGASADDVDEVTVVGNTVMEHLFAGLHPHRLGVWPYQPVSRRFMNITAKEAGLALSSGVNTFIFPVVSGFVGGDTLAAVLAEADGYPGDIRLIIDIGTNGEIVLMTPEGIWATSCATGPAFEGGHLSRGMRAAPGAIDKVSPGPSGRGFLYHTLGEEYGMRPMGICGSGIIDAVALMLKNGIILPNGRLNEKDPSVIRDPDGIGCRIILAPKEDGPAGEDIYLSILDVRQIQLAKAAMAVGIEMLMKRAGVSRVDATVLTGAFGVKFDWAHACDIGMFPACLTESKVEPKVNLAGIGAVKALLDRRHRREADHLQKAIRLVELSTDPQFSNAFAKATRFPDL